MHLSYSIWSLPHAAPEKLKKSPAPRFHAASQMIRRELYEGYRHFLTASEMPPPGCGQATPGSSFRLGASRQPHPGWLERAPIACG
jgi:hypothetical protein